MLDAIRGIFAVLTGLFITLGVFTVIPILFIALASGFVFLICAIVVIVVITGIASIFGVRFPSKTQEKK